MTAPSVRKHVRRERGCTHALLQQQLLLLTRFLARYLSRDTLFILSHRADGSIPDRGESIFRARSVASDNDGDSSARARALDRERKIDACATGYSISRVKISSSPSLASPGRLACIPGVCCRCTRDAINFPELIRLLYDASLHPHCRCHRRIFVKSCD